MTPVRWVIVVFWLLVIVLVLRGFFQLTMSSQSGKPEFGPGVNLAAPSRAPSAPKVADVIEQSWAIKNDVPGMVTVELGLRNRGGATAKGLQAYLAPYLGATTGNSMNARIPVYTVTEDTPLGQIGQWVSYPDLAPGQTATNSATFPVTPECAPLPVNLRPKLIFTSDKP